MGSPPPGVAGWLSARYAPAPSPSWPEVTTFEVQCANEKRIVMPTQIRVQLTADPSPSVASVLFDPGDGGAVAGSTAGHFSQYYEVGTYVASLSGAGTLKIGVDDADNSPTECYGYVNWLSVGSTVSALPNNAFAGVKLVEAYVPDSVVSVGTSAFYGCSDLSSLTIMGNPTFGTGVTNTFSGCSSLTAVNLPGMTVLDTTANGLIKS